MQSYSTYEEHGAIATGRTWVSSSRRNCSGWVKAAKCPASLMRVIHLTGATTSWKYASAKLGSVSTSFSPWNMKKGISKWLPCWRNLRALDGIRTRPNRAHPRGLEIPWQRFFFPDRPGWRNHRYSGYSFSGGPGVSKSSGIVTSVSPRHYITICAGPLSPVKPRSRSVTPAAIQMTTSAAVTCALFDGI